MAILKIARMGHPVLLQMCEPVANPGSPEIRRLVADMMDTMEDASGAGLAAPQVHVPLRLFVFRVSEARGNEDADDTPIGNNVVVNPEIELLTEDRILRWEGCLSIPGLRAAVPRAPRIRYRGVDCDGRPVSREVAGFHAGVVQHEYDHLDGILYPMRMQDFSLFGFTEELARAAAQPMTPPERSAERDAAIAAMLPHVPFDGWTRRSLRMGLADIAASPDDAELLFPGGTPDMIEAFCDWADRRMETAAATLDPALRLHQRVRAVIALRLEQNRPHKETIRRALALLTLPRNARLAAACTARTVDAIWHAAGDRSADFSWYTKRAILAAVYVTTVLFWLRDAGEDDAATLGFLDRRLAGVGRVGTLRRCAETAIGRLRPA
jgi:peptide deformylase